MMCIFSNTSSLEREIKDWNLKQRWVLPQTRGTDDLLLFENLNGWQSTELRYLTRVLTSTRFRMSFSNTTSAKSFWSITGKRIALTISSPRILLLVVPSASKPCLSHSFEAHMSTALNRSISSIFSVSLITTVSSKFLSIVTNPSDFAACSILSSITLQHRSTRAFSWHFWANGRMMKTLDGSKFLKRYSVHLWASEGTMYFFAKYNTPMTLLPLKLTSSQYMKLNNSSRLS